VIRASTAGDGPKSFDQFRELAQAIAHQKLLDKNGNPITVAVALSG
jgi:hypothetical protein